MPSVPRIRDERVTQEAVPGIRLQPQATEETFGGGASGKAVGDALTDVFDVGTKFAIQQKRNADDVVVQDADNQLALAQTDLEIKIASMKGRDAMASMNTLDDEWKKIEEERTKSLNNEDQKTAYRAKSNARYIAARDFTKKHMYREEVQFDLDSTNTGVATDRDTAVRKFYDDKSVGDSISHIYNRLADHSKRNGLATQDEKTGAYTFSPQTQDKLNTEISKTVSQVYSQRMHSGDEKGAESLRLGYKQYLVKEDIDAMREMKENIPTKLLQQQERALKDTLNKNGDDAIDRMLKFEYDDLSDIKHKKALGAKGDSNGYTKEDATLMEDFLNDKVVRTEIAKRNQLKFGIADKYYGLDRDSDNIIDPDANHAKITAFRQGAFEAYHAGVINQKQLKKKIDATKLAFPKGLSENASDDFKRGKSSWAFYKSFFGNTYTYKDASGDEKKLNAGQFEALAGEAGARLMERQLEKPFANEEESAKETHNILRELVREFNPASYGRSEITHAIGGEGQRLRRIYEGPTEVKADRTVSPSTKVVKPKINAARLNYTAQKHGISVDEVLKRMSMTDEDIDNSAKSDK